jgi:heme/copper-type cytochrome/quinol oxidase subunit 2
MHVICGSKDVIHSWAIPGLGIKIDCIPGFNSHRRVLLRWRGVYWGQCMEVCGRYHHWMPILIRVTHKDQFLSWCLAYLRALDQQDFTGTHTTARLVEAWLSSETHLRTARELLAALR